jgi:hypothetical protein
MLLGQRRRSSSAWRGDLYTLFLEARDDLANKPALDGVGFQDDERSFHTIFSAKSARKSVAEF